MRQQKKPDLDQRIVDSIKRQTAQGQTVKLDDIVSDLRALDSHITEHVVTRAMSRLKREGVIEYLGKRNANGDVRKVWGWVLVEKKSRRG